MSLVADVLASAKHKDCLKDISLVEMEKLMKKSEEARVSVCQALNSYYVELSSSFNHALILQDNLSTCLKDVSGLEIHIKEQVIPSVEGSENEIGRVKRRWNEMKKELEATQHLLDIHTLLEESYAAHQRNDFNAEVGALNQVENLLDEDNLNEVTSQLEILSALREELVLKRSDLVLKISEIWNKFLAFSEESSSNGAKIVNLIVEDMESKQEEEEKWDCGPNNMFSALNKLGELRRHVRIFAKNVLEHFIKPILCESGELEVFSKNDSGVSVMHVKRPPKPAKVNDPTSAVKALNGLEMMFRFLYGHLSRFPIEEDTKVVSLMSLFGAEIEEEFMELVLTNCLEQSVPCDRKNLQGFGEVQMRVEDFHKFLVKIDFYSNDHNTLLNYVANVETVYGNKTCASILMKARNLVLKPLHLTTSVGPMKPEAPLTALDETRDELKDSALRLRNLSPKTFHLPECKVSVSVCELVDLIYSTLDEACASAPEFALRLFHAARNILTLYCHVTPVAHAQTLLTSPEYAALIHNNGVYVCHHALLLGHHYRSRFPASLQELSLTTADLGYLIRASGCEVFLKAMQSHKNTLTEVLRKGLESSLSKSDITSVSPLHSSVQECLQQLQRLRDAWQEVLPASVYIKSIGTLAGSLVEDLVLRIVALEEISADDAIGLINVLSLLTAAIPTLFDEGEESAAAAPVVTQQVRMWEKMNELIVVLGASLKDLDKRWGEGKGPLARHFTSGEVKHLIKAIFQNTERRAKLLARIK